MDFDRLIAAVLIAEFKRSHWKDDNEASKAIVSAYNFISSLGYKFSVDKAAKGEPVMVKAVAEIDKVELAADGYSTIVKRTVTKGKTLYVSKVEMYCDNYASTQWEFYVNSELVELENNKKWTDIYLPVALTLTFDGKLEIQSEKTIEVKAKDSAEGNAWGDITGAMW